MELLDLATPAPIHGQAAGCTSNRWTFSASRRMAKQPVSQKRSMYRYTGYARWGDCGKMMITWETIKLKFGNTQCSDKPGQTNRIRILFIPRQMVSRTAFSGVAHDISWSSGYVAPTHSPVHLAALTGGTPRQSLAGELMTLRERLVRFSSCLGFNIKYDIGRNNYTCWKNMDKTDKTIPWVTAHFFWLRAPGKSRHTSVCVLPFSSVTDNVHHMSDQNSIFSVTGYSSGVSRTAWMNRMEEMWVWNAGSVSKCGELEMP